MMKLRALNKDPAFGLLAILVVALVVSSATSGDWIDMAFYLIPGLVIFFIKRPDKNWRTKISMSLLAILSVLIVLTGSVGVAVAFAYSHVVIGNSNVISSWELSDVKRGVLPLLYTDYPVREFYPEYHPRVFDLRPATETGHRLKKLSQGVVGIEAKINDENEELIITLSQMRPSHCPYIIQSLISHERLSEVSFLNIPISLSDPADGFYNEVKYIAINSQEYFVQSQVFERPWNGMYSAIKRTSFGRADLIANTANLRPYCEHHKLNEFASATIHFQKLPLGDMNYIETLIEIDTQGFALGAEDKELIQHLEQKLFSEEELEALPSESPPDRNRRVRNRLLENLLLTEHDPGNN